VNLMGAYCRLDLG